MGNNHGKKSKRFSEVDNLEDDKQPKQEKKQIIIPEKAPELSQTDLEFLTQHTDSSAAYIQNIFDSFIANNTDAKLDRNEFIRFYNELRPEPADLLVNFSFYSLNNC